MATYALTTLWYLEAPIIRVFDTLGEAPMWSDWWPNLIAVEERDVGADDGMGRVYHYIWRSRLGYRLCFDIRVTSVGTHRLEAAILPFGDSMPVIDHHGGAMLRPIRRAAGIFVSMAGDLFSPPAGSCQARSRVFLLTA